MRSSQLDRQSGKQSDWPRAWEDPGAAISGVNAVLFSTTEAKEVLVSEQSVEARVGLATLSHEASESDGVLLARHLALLVHLHLLATRQNDGD